MGADEFKEIVFNRQEEMDLMDFGFCDENIIRLIIPNDITELSELDDLLLFEFKFCTKELVIGYSVANIDAGMFSDWHKLTSIIVDESNEHYKSIDGNLYSKDGKTLIQYAIGKTQTTFIIPNGVTSIGHKAFSGCDKLTSIVVDEGNKHYKSIDGNLYSKDGKTLTQYAIGKTQTTFIIPNGVTSIGEFAFSDCSSLTSVTIPDSVTSIGNSAFYYCSNLTSVTLGNSVTSIGYEAFYKCSNLTNITVSENNTKYKSIDGNLYSKDGKTLIQYAIGKTQTTFIIPNGVTSIGYKAFFGCSSLTSVTIGNSVTSIGERAFYHCSSLKSIYYTGTASQWASIDGLNNIMSSSRTLYINNESLTNVVLEGITEIKPYAFYYCSSLKSVTIGNSVKSIERGVFSSCSKLTKITVSENNTKYKSIDGNLYSKDGKTLIQYAIGKTQTTFIIPNGVTSIGKFAFSDCSSLKSVTIPNSVTSIGNGAFYNCSNLTSVTIGNSVTSIGGSAFYNCSSLSEVTIGNSVTSVGYQAFSGCSNLEYNEYDNAYYLGNENSQYVVLIKAKNTSITSCEISENTKVIYDSAFWGCSNLTSVTIGNSVTSIGGSAFYDCSDLTSITIPDSVTSIGDFAFQGCSKLTEITIPDSVTSIGNGAFYDCSDLTSVMFKRTSGWTAGSNTLSSSSLSKPAFAATYLTTTYVDYGWNRP